MPMAGMLCMLDQSGNTCDGRIIKSNKNHNSRRVKPGSKKDGVNIDHTEQEVRLTPDLALELLKVAPTADSSDRAGRCLQELNSIVRQFGAGWHVRPFGSFANGFATISSDLDITCCQGGRIEDDVERHSVTVLCAIGRVLRTHSLFVIDEEILGARVPILKLRFENILNVDMSCHNQVPLLNTRLLLAYSRMDPLVRDLGVAIKLWSKKAGVCGASQKNLSSYSFTLLVVYFLQVHPDVRLPVLPVETFYHGTQDYDPRIVNARKHWRCELSLQGLMTRFFSFYSNQDSEGFCWGREVASVRLGERCMIEEAAFSSLGGRYVQRLHIEDPYQLDRNLHCVLGKVDEEEQLRNALREACTDLRQSQVPRAFKANPICVSSEKEESLTALPLNSANDIKDMTARINGSVQLIANSESLEKGDSCIVCKVVMVDPVVLDPSECFFTFSCRCPPVFVCEGCRTPTNTAILAHVPNLTCLSCQRVCHDLAKKGRCTKGDTCRFNHKKEALIYFKMCFKPRNAMGQQRRLKKQKRNAEQASVDTNV